MSLTSKLSQKSKDVKVATNKEPLWLGPESCSEERGGITFSLLTRFMSDPERFRLHTIEGVKPRDSFNHKLEYGNLWHACEEAFAKKNGNKLWMEALGNYVVKLQKKYPTAIAEIDKWYNVCRVQFPVYVDFWKKHPDMTDRKPLFSEQTFHVEYKLPSGRTVYLRGKWDSGDVIGKGKQAAVWLQENKAKGRIEVETMLRQLGFDGQTMLYVVSLLEEMPRRGYNLPFGGVRYNVIRRPLTQGNSGCIVRHKAKKSKPEETLDSYYQRLSAIITTEPEYHFMRWNVKLSPEDVSRFKNEFLNPTLERLCDWYSWITKCNGNPFSPNNGCENSVGGAVSSSIHYRAAFGMYDPLTNGKGVSDLDYHLETGSMVGLERTTQLFPELQED